MHPMDRRPLFALGFLLISIIAGVGGEEPRLSRSIADRPDRPRWNSIKADGRDRRGGYSTSMSSHREGSISPIDRTMIFLSPAASDDSGESRDREDDKLLRVIMSKDYAGSSASDIEQFDRIGERIIARANITEEAKRVVRQVKNQRPGFFWTLFRVAFETVNETRSVVQQISSLVEANFAPDTTTARGVMNAALTTNGTTTPRATATDAGNSTEEPITTTEEPYRLTRTGLEGIVRRNFRGLIRLFNIEWRDALNASQTNVREFQRDLGNQISPFLQDNPDVV